MRSPLQRLYETKLAFLATIFAVGGVALLVFAEGASHQHGLGWLGHLPIADLGSVLFTTGLVVIAFEYLDDKDSEQRATRRLRRILREQALAMRDAVISGFAFDAQDLARASSPAVLDRIARNALAIQLGDQGLADEVYQDVREQVLRPGERRTDLRGSVALVEPGRWRSSLAEETRRVRRLRAARPSVERSAFSGFGSHRT